MSASEDPRAWREWCVWCRVLAPGGEFYFSDVYCDRRLPKHVQDHEVRCCAANPGVLHT